MEKLKLSQAWVIGETIVWSIFIIVTALVGLSMMQVMVKLSHPATLWLGRVTLAFSLLALFYLTFVASRHRSKQWDS